MSVKSAAHGRKGQSAIEYLMTYGWMLLVVAIVGGAIFATVNNQRQQCSGDIPATLSPGQNDGFGVSQFGVSSSGAQIAISNDGTEEVTITQVELGSESDPAGDTLGIGEETTYTLSGWTPAEGCTEARLNVTYDVGQLTDQQISGLIEDQME